MTTKRQARSPKGIISVPTAGERLGIGRNASYAAARANQLPVIRLGKRLVVSEAALDRMIETGAMPGREVA